MEPVLKISKPLTYAVVMNGAALGAAFAVVASCSDTPRPGSEVASGKPPVRFRGDTTALVMFVSDVETACRKAGLKHVAGTVTEGCTVLGGERPVVIIPNGCKKSGQYAVNICHEIGHVNGWPPTHGE
jgi:hypothetical protein